MRTHRLLTGAAALAATAALAALAAFAQAPAGADACALVDTAEMSRIVARPVALATAGADQGGPFCTYGLTREGPLIVLSRLQGDWDAMVQELADAPQERVPNLGAAAVWTPRDYALLVRSEHGAILRVSLNDREQALRGGDLKGVAVDVARAALKRLGG